METINQKTQAGAKGIHKFTICDIRHPRAVQIQEEICELLRRIKSPSERWEELQEMVKELKRLTMVREKIVENIIPTVGRAVIAKWLIGDNTYTADTGINYGSLGDDNTAPTNADTTLGNETYRKAIASVSQVDNQAFVAAFYTATEVSGTFEECGLHIVGTGSADTGQLFSHFLTGGIVKSTTETLTVESEITIS